MKRIKILHGCPLLGKEVESSWHPCIIGFIPSNIGVEWMRVEAMCKDVARNEGIQENTSYC